MKDFFKRLTSRKFLLTVAACLTLAANKQYTEIIYVVIAYVLAEMGVDIARAKSTEATVTTGQPANIFTPVDDDTIEPDKSVITPGLHQAE